MTKNNGLAFLGICSHVIPDYSIAPHIPQLTLINLRPISHHICFPAPLYEGYLIFCASSSQEDNNDFKISFKFGERQLSVFSFISGKVPHSPEAAEKYKQANDALITGINDGWNVFAVPLKVLNLAIPEIGLYEVISESNGEATKVGSIYFGKIQLPDLTAERLEEIRKDPKLTKAISFQIACGLCKRILRYHTSIDGEFAPPESIDVKELPHHYSCDSGNQSYDMRDAKSDLIKYLGTKMHYSTSEYHANASFINALTSQRAVFLEMLNSELREEEYQKFLSNNPFFLTIFAPKSIQQKLSLLGKFTTDFVIVDSRHDLVLIEIEKPSTKLVLADNANHSELTHAIGQLHNWLSIVDEHKSALISMWNMHHFSLNSVRGVVVAGRDYKYSKEQLKIMKTANSTDRIKVYTYDDLLRAVDVLIDSIHQP